MPKSSEVLIGGMGLPIESDKDGLDCSQPESPRTLIPSSLLQRFSLKEDSNPLSKDKVRSSIILESLFSLEETFLRCLEGVEVEKRLGRPLRGNDSRKSGGYRPYILGTQTNHQSGPKTSKNIQKPGTDSSANSSDSEVFSFYRALNRQVSRMIPADIHADFVQRTVAHRLLCRPLPSSTEELLNKTVSDEEEPLLLESVAVIATVLDKS